MHMLPLYDNQIKSFGVNATNELSGDSFSSSATSQMALVLCPNHMSPSTWVAGSPGLLAHGQPAVLRSKNVEQPGRAWGGAARGSQLFSWGFSWPHGGEGAHMLWPRAWRALLVPSQSIYGDTKICPIFKQEGSMIFLKWFPPSKNRPQRKVKRHVRETINTKETLFQNRENTKKAN